jgi:hypothetical protein
VDELSHPVQLARQYLKTTLAEVTFVTAIESVKSTVSYFAGRATTAKRDKTEPSSFLSLLTCPALSGYPLVAEDTSSGCKPANLCLNGIAIFSLVGLSFYNIAIAVSTKMRYT